MCRRVTVTRAVHWIPRRLACRAGVSYHPCAFIKMARVQANTADLHRSASPTLTSLWARVQLSRSAKVTFNSLYRSRVYKRGVFKIFFLFFSIFLNLQRLDGTTLDWLFRPDQSIVPKLFATKYPATTWAAKKKTTVN